MELTVCLERAGDQEFLPVQFGPEMTIADLKGVISADTGLATDKLALFLNEQPIANDTQTISGAGISSGDMIVVRVRRAQASAPILPPRQRQQQQQGVPQQVRDAAERIRLQALSQPAFLGQLRDQAPELADAVNDSARFLDSYAAFARRQQDKEREHQEMLARLEDDPFDVEAQRKIEEIIREQQVMKNYEEAMENTPEVFGRVNMLYIPVEVNGNPVKAFVDSGAQTTIMSPDCAERCGIMRLLDKRFGGIARGVGTAKILGRVHTAQLKVGNSFVTCSFTVMEGKGVEMLFGLDMLKRHQAVIDLAKGELAIAGERVAFLGEADLPKEAQENEEEPTVEGPAGLKTGAKSGQVTASEPAQGSGAGPSRAASASSAQQAPSQGQTGAAGSFPEEAVQQLVSLGFSRAEAIGALTATGGDVDQAGAMLFG